MNKDVTLIVFEERPLDATYQRGNDPAEYERAKGIFEELHPK